MSSPSSHAADLVRRPGPYARMVNRFSATKPGSWLVRRVAAKVDPKLFKLSNGRFTVTGKPTLPQLAMTTTGRRSGQPRSVQVAFHPDGDDYLIVASAMGQEHHPAWRYNIEANPEVEIQLRGRTVRARASKLDAAEKDRLWPAIATTIPQMNTYIKRTDRDLEVFRLTEI